jgi:hypothetical protein
MKLVACLQDAVEFLGKFIEGESYPFLSSSLDIWGRE